MVEVKDRAEFLTQLIWGDTTWQIPIRLIHLPDKHLIRYGIDPTEAYPTSFLRTVLGFNTSTVCVVFIVHFLHFTDTVTLAVN